MKAFLITIDTEGDNLWGWKYGDAITSNNALYLERFQLLCEKYNFKPVYLTNYEMASNQIFVKMAKKALEKGNCEVGMHLHAYNNPPTNEEIKIFNPNNFPFLIEYSDDVMEKKIAYLDNYLTEVFGIKPVTHRAGRWVLNEKYLLLLAKYGYKYDCSVTPHINWSYTKGITKNGRGNNYSFAYEKPFVFLKNNKSIVELPMTIRKGKKNFPLNIKSDGLKETLYKIKKSISPNPIWLRPNGCNIDDILKLIENERNKDSEYLMFMLHSSELMPGGSPLFLTNDDIDGLYLDIEKIFKKISEFCVGMTIQEYMKDKNIESMTKIKKFYK